MPVKQKTPQSNINRMIDSDVVEFEKDIRAYLNEVGIKAYSMTRDYTGKRYTDRTGNLRSSCGYALYKDGVLLDIGGFKPILDGQEGSVKGQSMARELGSKSGRGYTLFILAGESYAEAVESKGYNVLSGAKLLADKLFRDMKHNLKIGYGKYEKGGETVDSRVY